MHKSLAAVLLMGLAAAGFTQEREDYDNITSLSQLNISGPRLGITYVLDGSEFSRKLRENGLGPVISQFGWHFEFKTVPQGGGPAFVCEIIPLIGGVEYAKVLQSLTIPMGIRLPSGFEFGMGPSLVYGYPDFVQSGVVFAIGKAFRYRGVGLPVNVALNYSKEGIRTSFVFGYAIIKSKDKVPAIDEEY